MSDNGQHPPTPEAIIAAMEQAWKDHHHARNQTWKALQMEFLFAAAVVGINGTAGSFELGVVSGIILMITTLCGVQITMRHRNGVEVTKFRHIMNCEEALGLRENLIDNVDAPRNIKLVDAFNPFKGNTALFILRMHLAIFVFSILFLIWNLMRLNDQPV